MATPLNLAPLDPFEVVAAVLLAGAASPDAPEDALHKKLAAILSQGRAAGAVQPTELAAIQERVQARLPQLPLREAAAGANGWAARQVAAVELLVAAAPPAAACCLCGGLLELRTINSRAWFYCETHGPRRGQLFSKKCTTCGAVHFLNGYERGAAASGAARQPRRMYRDPAHVHPTWVAPSRETVISTQLLHRQLRAWHHSAISFQAGVNIYNDMFAPGQPGARCCAPSKCSLLCAATHPHHQPAPRPPAAAQRRALTATPATWPATARARGARSAGASTPTPTPEPSTSTP